MYCLQMINTIKNPLKKNYLTWESNSVPQNISLTCLTYADLTEKHLRSHRTLPLPSITPITILPFVSEADKSELEINFGL